MANSEHWVFNSQTGQYDLQNDNGVIQTTIRFVSDDISVFDGAIEDLENSGMYTNVEDDNFKETDIILEADNNDNIPVLPDPVDIPVSDNSLVSEMKIKNSLLQNQNNLLKQQNDLKYLDIKTNIEKMKIDVLFKLNNAKAIDASNKIKNKLLQVGLDSLIYNSKNSKSFNDISTETKNLVKATEDQEMTTSLSGVSMSLDNSDLVASNGLQVEALNRLALATETKENNINLGSITVDNKDLVSAYNLNTEQLTKIADTALLKKELLEFEKVGSENLKDSEGKIIKPREAKAIFHAEKTIEQKEMNNTPIEDLLDFNPFAFIDDILTEDWEKEIKLIEEEQKKNG